MSKPLWCGRFKGDQHPLFQKINHSIDVDIFLAPWDIQTSKAHARCLYQAKIIEQHDYDLIVDGLSQVAKAIKSGDELPQSHDEDVHMWIERLLTEKIGQAGKKLHTGRSRNDQVVTTLRLWMKEMVIDHLSDLASLIDTLITLAQSHIHTIMPGVTHLQAAQPISLAFYFTAYAYRLKRDYIKGQHLLDILDECPLGSGAIAGSNFELNRQLAAETLGFAKISAHAMDSISNRDFVADYLYFCTLVATHLSQMSEDFIIWQSSNYKFVTLSDGFSSGSSLMPQKKNPDAFELLRGKAAVINGRLNGLCSVLKGLPMAYNKDLQEDKHLVLTTAQDISTSLKVLPAMLQCTTYHTERMAEALSYSYANATDLADALVQLGLPFRDAHHTAGKLVAYAIDQQRELDELSLEELQSFCPSVDASIYDKIDYRKTLDNKKTSGSTHPKEVIKMIDELRSWINNLKE